MFRKVQSTTSCDSFKTTKDEDKTDSIDEESIEMGDETLLQMKMAEELGAIGGVVPSWPKGSTHLSGKPPLPPDLPLNGPVKDTKIPFVNPKNLEGGKGQELVLKIPVPTDPIGLIERAKTYEKQPFSKKCPIEQEAINQEIMRQDREMCRQLAAAKAQAIRAEKALRQSIRPNIDDLALIESSSDEEDNRVQTIKCDRCTQVLHKKDAKCPNCAKPRCPDMINWDLLPRKREPKP